MRTVLENDRKKKEREWREINHLSLLVILTPHAHGSEAHRISKWPVIQDKQLMKWGCRMVSPSVSPNTSFTSDGSPSREEELSEKWRTVTVNLVEDNVRLWEAGWKQRYYKNKFDVDAADENSDVKLFSLTLKDSAGFCDITRGCASWKWYYPFHYAICFRLRRDCRHAFWFWEGYQTVLNPGTSTYGGFSSC